MALIEAIFLAKSGPTVVNAAGITPFSRHARTLTSEVLSACNQPRPVRGEPEERQDAREGLVYPRVAAAI